MPAGVKPIVAAMFLAIVVVACYSSVDKNRKYYANAYSFGCYSAAEVEEAVKFIDSGQADSFWLKILRGDNPECQELKPGLEVCIQDKAPGDIIKVGTCGQNDGLWTLKRSISGTREQAMSAPNMLPARGKASVNAPPTRTSAEDAARKEREELIQESFSEGKVCMGMSMAQVEQVWGKPAQVKKVTLLSNTGRSGGVEWIYSDGASVVFRDGEAARFHGTKNRGTRR
ncbi:MAG: hypothetical protein ACLQDI_06390 [Syntrophobacteraceae bacterium]